MSSKNVSEKYAKMYAIMLYSTLFLMFNDWA